MIEADRRLSTVGQTPAVRTKRRWHRPIIAVIVMALVGGACWWAGRTTAASTQVENDRGAAQITAIAKPGKVGRSLTFNVSVRQPFQLVATNALAGTVTSVSPGGEISLGQELYRVDNVAVRAVAGSTPFYRDLTQGHTGPDVRELSEAMVALGHATKASDTFDAQLTRAVRQWQKSVGVEPTGTIPRGELVAVGNLPTTARLGEDIAASKLVVGGEEAVFAPTGALSFVLVLSRDQAASIADGTAVSMTYEDHVWSASVHGREDTDDGNVTLTLTAPDGGLPCGSECSVLPAQESLSLLAQVEIVPEVEGITVPASAVRTAADGSAYVVTKDGEHLPVTTTASSGGIAVVDGVPDGTEVVISDGAPPSGSGTSTGS